MRSMRHVNGWSRLALGAQRPLALQGKNTSGFLGLEPIVVLDFIYVFQTEDDE